MSIKSGVGNLLHSIQESYCSGSWCELSHFDFLLDRLQHFGHALQAQAADFFVDTLPALSGVSLNVIPEKLPYIVDRCLELANSTRIDLRQAWSGCRGLDIFLKPAKLLRG